MRITLFLFAAVLLLLLPCVASAADLTVATYLQDSLPPQEGRKITYNQATKMLTVTDTKPNQNLIKNLIKQFEVGPKQVMIETRFVEVDVTDIWDLGVEYSFFHEGHPSNKGIRGARVGPGTVNWDNSATSTFPLSLGGYAGQLMLFKILEAGDYYLANLRALAEQGKVNLISSPKITTVAGQMANIQVVRAQPYVSDFTLENIGTAENPIWSYKLTLAEKPIGIFLEATPYVTEGSNTITLDLHPEVSILKDQVRISTLTTSGETGALGNVTAVGSLPLIPAELGWPVVDVRTAQTSVVVDSGQTIVLGGMIKDEEIVIKKKVPVLGDIPFLGKAFQYDYKNQRKKNLLIFITASIINARGEVIK
jgi:type II secretory pathway component GspD/PulD (secretin)